MTRVTRLAPVPLGVPERGGATHGGMMNTIRIGAVSLAVAVLAACGGGSGGNARGVEVDGAWIRASIPGKDMTAGYMSLRNTGDAADELVGASLPAGVAERTEIHESVAVGDGSPATMGHGDHMSGTNGGSTPPVMEMRRVSRIELPEGKTVRLEPGGYHLMIFGVKEPLEAGRKVEVELRFRHAGTVTVTAEVRTG